MVYSVDQRPGERTDARTASGSEGLRLCCVRCEGGLLQKGQQMVLLPLSELDLSLIPDGVHFPMLSTFLEQCEQGVLHPGKQEDSHPRRR